MKFLQTYERVSARRRYIGNDKENSCLISLDEIKYGEYYYACDKCHKPFSYDAFKLLFRTNIIQMHRFFQTHKCPHCRISLSHYPTLYVNKKTLSDYITHFKKLFKFNSTNDEENDDNVSLSNIICQ